MISTFKHHENVQQNKKLSMAFNGIFSIAKSVDSNRAMLFSSVFFNLSINTGFCSFQRKKIEIKKWKIKCSTWKQFKKHCVSHHYLWNVRFSRSFKCKIVEFIASWIGSESCVTGCCYDQLNNQLTNGGWSWCCCDVFLFLFDCLLATDFTVLYATYTDKHIRIDVFFKINFIASTYFAKTLYIKKVCVCMV